MGITNNYNLFTLYPFPLAVTTLRNKQNKAVFEEKC